MDSIKAYATYKMHESLAKGFSKTKSRGFVQLTVNKPAYQSFRWIIGNLNI